MNLEGVIILHVRIGGILSLRKTIFNRDSGPLLGDAILERKIRKDTEKAPKDLRKNC